MGPMSMIQERNRQILQRRKEGVSQRAVAEEFALSPSRIYLIERRYAADTAMDYIYRTPIVKSPTIQSGQRIKNAGTANLPSSDRGIEGLRKFYRQARGSPLASAMFAPLAHTTQSRSTYRQNSNPQRNPHATTPVAPRTSFRSGCSSPACVIVGLTVGVSIAYKGSMTVPGDSDVIVRQSHQQMLKLVAKSFYQELIKYGVNKSEVLTVAAHLLDNVLQNHQTGDKGTDCFNRLFTIKDIQDDWLAHQRLSLKPVSLTPLQEDLIPRVAEWLKAPLIQDSFYPRFPESQEELRNYFVQGSRRYFCIHYEREPVGLIGAENIDSASARLEMRKFVGNRALQGKGIGKRATGLFLYYVFMRLNFHKVYIHSMEVNIRNLNLNSRFGFELEGVFMQEVLLAGQRQDVVRMGLARSVWLGLFS